MEDNKEITETKKKKEVTLESISKGLLINRIIGLSCFVILLGIFIVALLAYREVDRVLLQTRPVVERIQNLDLDRIQCSINEINSFVEQTDFDHVSKVVESVPEDIFDQFTEVQGYLEQIASFSDMKDELTLAIDNFNQLSVQLDEFQKKMEPLLKLFSK